MLVLSRMKGEVICIGNDIEIVVVSTSTGRCKLGIVAPENTKILRKELISGRQANTYPTNRYGKESDHPIDPQD